MGVAVKKLLANGLKSGYDFVTCLRNSSDLSKPQLKTTHFPSSCFNYFPHRKTHPSPYLEGWVCVCDMPCFVQVKFNFGRFACDVLFWNKVFKYLTLRNGGPNVWHANLDYRGSKPKRPPSLFVYTPHCSSKITLQTNRTAGYHPAQPNGLEQNRL